MGPEKPTKIILFHHDEHIDYIKSLPAFFNQKQFCFKCFKPYQYNFYHKCNKFCKICNQKNCLNDERVVKCNNCGITCNGQKCLINHQEGNCSKYVKCTTCGRLKIHKHVCEGRWCLNCSKAVDMDHKCFILTQDERDSKTCAKKRNANGEIKIKTEGYIFFDYESMNVDGNHIPNLIIADQMCFNCIDSWNLNDARKICEKNVAFRNLIIIMIFVIGSSNKIITLVLHTI